MFILSVIGILCLINGHQCAKTSKYVTTHVNSHWQAPPLQLEVAEFLHDEDPTLFWKFINTLTNQEEDFINQS